MLADLPDTGCVLLALLPVSLELVGSPGDFSLEALPRFPLLRVGDGGQEVACSLTRWTIPAHGLEILLGDSGGAEEDLSSFIENDGFVEDIEDGLRCLVDRYGVAHIANVGSDTQRPCECESCGGIKTSGTVVPACNRASGKSHLCYTDSLFENG